MTQKSESVREAEQRRTALYEVNLRWPVKANDRGAILTTPAEIAQFAESYAKSDRLALARQAEQEAERAAKGWILNPPFAIRELNAIAAWLREKAR